MKRILSLALLLIIVFSGCTKKKESRIIGKWEDVQRVANPTTRNVWTFEDGTGFTVESFNVDDDILISKIVGEYDLFRKNSQFNLKLEVLSGAINYYGVEGVYWVEEVDRDFLKITREEFLSDTIPGNPFVRFEMVKL